MKNTRTILEIIGEAIALFVLIVMVCQWSKMGEQNKLSRKAVEKMAEQNALSTASIARIDSTIKLMREANELTKESNDLTKQYVGVEAKRTTIEENKQKEEQRPRLVINLKASDIVKDTIQSNYTAWINVHNEGSSEAQGVNISTTIADQNQILGSQLNSSFNNIPPNGLKHHPVKLPSKSSNLFLLIELDYKWIQPNGQNIQYPEHKGYQLFRDSLTYDFLRCLQMYEDDINNIFRTKR
jgi:hypothetical protein